MVAQRLPSAQWIRTTATTALLAPAFLLLIPLQLGAQSPVGDVFASPTVKSVTVMVGGYEVFATLNETDAPIADSVVALLSTPDGEQRARARVYQGADGGLEIRFVTGGATRRRAVSIRPGDKLDLRPEARESASWLVIPVVPVLTALVNSDSNSVAGQSPIGREISVSAVDSVGGFATRRVTADESGAWVADFGGELRLGPGSRGNAVFEEDGIGYQTDWVVYDLEVDIGATSLSVAARRGESIRAEITGIDGLPKAGAQAVAWAGEAALLPHDIDGNSAPVLPGDTVRVTFGEERSLSVPVPQISAHVDPNFDWLEGVTEPLMRLRCASGGEAIEVQATFEGHYYVNFRGLVDLGYKSEIDISFVDGPAARMLARASNVNWLDALGAAAWGYGPAGTPVVLSVLQDDSVIREAVGRVNATGHFTVASLDSKGSVVDILPGQVVRVAVDDEVFDFPLFGHWSAADLAENKVYGRGAPYQTIWVDRGKPPMQYSPQADSEGNWAVEGLEPALVAGEVLRIRGYQGGVTEAVVTYRTFRSSVQVGGSTVHVEGHPGLAARAELRRRGEQLAVGECRVVRGSCDLSLEEADGTVPIIQPGDLVIVTPDVGEPVELEVVELTAHFDLGTGSVVGQSEPGGQVRVQFSHKEKAETPIDATARVFSNGVYDLELDAAQSEQVVPGLVADVYYELPSHHQLHARAVVELVQVTPGSSTVTGLAEPGSPIHAMYFGPECPDGGAQAIADDEGQFELNLAETGGKPIAASPGCTVEVEHQRSTHVVPVAGLAGWLLDPVGEGSRTGSWPDGTLAGATEQGLGVWSLVRYRALPSLDEALGRVPPDTFRGLLRLSGTPDPSGVFVVGAHHVSYANVHGITVVAELPSGDQLRRPVGLINRANSALIPFAGKP